ncbi:hypothetical protein [Nocardia miyunensis]|uniref:hypothetical protein n=1 Tax=Nocardia miyunensis TaxID=282684 RepID=UPI000AAB3AD2|nr:hypothetical protein [Nocardia miyunensis]
MIGKPSSPVRWEAERKRASTPLEPRRSADPTAWITKHRRCVRDYETRPDHHEAIVYIAMIFTMTRRLARATGS